MEVKVCKLILLGNGSVGKTSICQRFKDDGFQKVYRQTVGLDFLEKRLEIRCRVVGCNRCDVGFPDRVPAMQVGPPICASSMGHWGSKHQQQAYWWVYFWFRRHFRVLRCDGYGLVP